MSELNIGTERVRKLRDELNRHSYLYYVLNNPTITDAEYDALMEQTKTEFDPAKREQLFIKMNDMLVEDVVMVPTVWRAVALGASKDLDGMAPTPWDSITWNIYEWHFVTP